MAEIKSSRVCDLRIKEVDETTNGPFQSNVDFQVLDLSVTVPLKLMSSIVDQNADDVSDQLKRFPLVPLPRPLQEQSFFSSYFMDTDSLGSGNGHQQVNEFEYNPFTKGIGSSNFAPLGSNSGPLGSNSVPWGSRSVPLGSRSGPLASSSGPLASSSGPLASSSGPLTSSSVMDHSNGSVESKSEKLKTRRQTKLEKKAQMCVLSQHIIGHRGDDDIDSLVQYINSSSEQKK